MSYRVELTTEAEGQLKGLPAPVALRVQRQLNNLARDPALLSKPSHSPFVPGCQLMSFDYDHDAKRWFVNILFEYAQDEQTLIVLAIVVQAVEEWLEG